MSISSTLTADEERMLAVMLEGVDRRLRSIDTSLLLDEGLLPTPQEAYLTGTYPPLKAMRVISASEVYADATQTLSLYVHVPFCLQRCTFCHFAKEINAESGRVHGYLDMLEREIEFIERQFASRQRLESVYVGGGTPSSLEPDDIDRILAAISEHFVMDDETEFTFELHPQVVRQPARLREQFGALIDGGVNRIAFGAQTLDDRGLTTLNRGHTAQDVVDLVHFLDGEGFENYSIDLMYGLPYESLEGWFSTLSRLVELGVSKLNVFPLFLKVTDPISSLYARRPDIFPDYSQRLRTHFLTELFLEDHGFVRGPALYYSRKDRHSAQQELKFNDIEDVNLLGAGVSSFGYLGHTQYYNTCDLDEYLATVNRGVLPVWRGETLTVDERARRAVMFGLRSAGISRPRFASRFGRPPEELLPEIERFAQMGLLTCVDDVWQASDIGCYCLDGMAAQLASEDVRYRVEATNRLLEQPQRSAVEQHDYFPLGRTGSSIPQPRTSGQRR